MPHTESLRLNTPGYKDVCQIHPTGLGEFVNGKFHTLMQVFSCLRTTTDNMLYGSPSPTDASETTYVSLCACLSHLDPRGPQAFHNARLLRLVPHGHRACKNRTGSCRYALLESTQPIARITLRLPCCPGFQDYTYLKTDSTTVQNCTSADSVYLL